MKKGTRTHGRPKVRGEKKKVHEITSTDIGVGYFMYWHFNRCTFFFQS